MNCSLSDKERSEGMRCRSIDCQPCITYGISTNDANIINTYITNMKLKEENESLRTALMVCRRDYFYMIECLSSLPNTSGEIDSCLTRMKYRKPIFEILKINKE